MLSTFFRRFIPLALLAAAIGGGSYVKSEGFSRKWCGFVMEQFEKRNIYLTLDRLTLDPMEGLVARNIKIFQEKDRKVMLMEMDRLNLDLDYGKMIKNELFLEGVDLRQADLAVPMDPEDPSSEVLNVTDFNARLYLVGERVEVRKAEGTLFGLRVHLTGSILRPTWDGKETEEEARERQRKRLAAIHARRALIVEAARLLRNFESANAPTMDIEVNGDLDKPEELIATMQLTANGLKHGTYVCEELHATATYSGETVDLSRLHIKDHLGTVEASATWQLGGSHVDFHVNSTADLPGLASSISPKEAFREFVFYEPVELVADGQFLMGAAVPEDAFLPIKCVGTMNARRFATRGQVMDGLEGSFGISPEGWHVRDGLLRHESGTLNLQAMWQKSAGVRYKALLQMDPKVFLPFIKLPVVRDILNNFEFRQESTIYAEVEGSGANPRKLRSLAKADARRFKYRGMEVTHVTSDMEFEGPVQVYKNIRLDRADGVAVGKEVRCDAANHTVTLSSVSADVDPVALVNCFSPKVAEIIAHYRFDETPQVAVDGIIYTRSPGTDLAVKFTSVGEAHYALWKEDYVIKRPTGSLHFKDGQIMFDVAGASFGRPLACQGEATLVSDTRNYTVHLNAGSFPYEVFGKDLPFEQVRADVVCRANVVDFNVKARAFGGNFSMKGMLDDRVKGQPYKGEMQIGGVEFKKFAHVYSPENDTEGDLTGFLKFSGRLDDWKALKGSGALTMLNGNLYAVPILGPLTPLLGALLPRPIAGYNLAKEADCTFTVADGFITTDNIEALTGVFRLVSKGTIDFVEDRIQFEAQAKLRGLPGLVFFPVSEILEYIAEGSVGNPVWRPRYFSSSKEKKEFRKADEAPEAATMGAPAVRRETPAARPTRSWNPFKAK